MIYSRGRWIDLCLIALADVTTWDQSNHLDIIVLVELGAMTFSIQQRVSLRQLGLLIPTERIFWLGWVVEIATLVSHSGFSRLPLYNEAVLANIGTYLI